MKIFIDILIAVTIGETILNSQRNFVEVNLFSILRFLDKKEGKSLISFLFGWTILIHFIDWSIINSIEQQHSWNF